MSSRHGEASSGAVAFCPRCAREVRVDRPWAGWRVVRGVWFAVMAAAFAAFPFLSADYCVMLPTFMVVFAAAGPVSGLASKKAACRRCRLELE